MSLSIIIPVYNEINQIKFTIQKLIRLKKNFKKFEIIFVDDFSNDGTFESLNKKYSKMKFLKVIKNKKKGLGSAIEQGIIKSKNKYICIFMCDLSDDVNDLKKYYKIISKENIDAVFGSRFYKNSNVKNYPFIKLFLNRVFNNFVRLIFWSRYNDFTNAFKIYNSKTLKSLLPIVSENFNVFLEIPLKIIVRRYMYKTIAINWTNRKYGKSKFKIKELSSMYLFTLLYCLLEKILLKKNN
jgi:dolichol-phosphate mannosyltransferase